MKWIKKYPVLGDERTIEKFLWFPVTVRNTKSQSDEIRWLERAVLIQVYTANCDYSEFWRTKAFATVIK